MSGKASPPKRGRPSSGMQTTRIRLRKDTFNSWIVKKNLFGFSEKTHSEFAEYLLHNCHEPTAQSSPRLPSTPTGNKNR